MNQLGITRVPQLPIGCKHATVRRGQNPANHKQQTTCTSPRRRFLLTSANFVEKKTSRTTRSCSQTPTGECHQLQELFLPKITTGVYAMAKIDRTVVLILSLIVVSSWVPICYSSKKPAGVARKEDIPFIKCQVCEILANQLYHQVQSKQAQISPKKISEYEIIETTENVCNLKKQEADWILKIDIVEQGDRLVLVEQESEGQCNSECKTIERACQEVLGYYDTDVAEYLYKKKPQIDALVKFLCKDLSEACSTKPPPVPKGRTPGEPFLAKSSKEAEMDKILKSMEGMPGAPGMKMYSREDLMKNLDGKDPDEDDDEDDDDESSFPSNLGKVLRQKESKKSDWKQKIVKGIQETSEVLKSHATKVSFRLQKWWKGMKAGSKNSKSKKAEL